MRFESTASWPREAEESLNWKKERASKYLRLTEKNLLQGITIEAEPAADGYFYAIRVETDLKVLLKERALARVLKHLPRQDEKFIAEFTALIEVQSVGKEWTIINGPNNEELFILMEDGRTIHTIDAELTEGFREFIIAKDFIQAPTNG